MKKNFVLLMAVLGIALGINAQTISDIDGNTYNTVTIGNQVWMAEDLRTTSYSDGSPIAS